VAHVWGIAAFCVNVVTLAAALVIHKLETVSVDLAQHETCFSALKKRSPTSAAAAVGRRSGG